MQTVTMLFTDIEGSTRLLDGLGRRYTEVLTTQRALLRRAFVRWHWREMGTEGDSFFVVFDSVTDAVQGAAEGQRALARTAWPDGVRVEVPMGMHTGEPVPHEGPPGAAAAAPPANSEASEAETVTVARARCMLGVTGSCLRVDDVGDPAASA